LGCPKVKAGVEPTFALGVVPKGEEAAAGAWPNGVLDVGVAAVEAAPNGESAGLATPAPVPKLNGAGVLSTLGAVPKVKLGADAGAAVLEVDPKLKAGVTDAVPDAGCTASNKLVPAEGVAPNSPRDPLDVAGLDESLFVLPNENVDVLAAGGAGIEVAAEAASGFPKVNVDTGVVEVVPNVNPDGAGDVFAAVSGAELANNGLLEAIAETGLAKAVSPLKAGTLEPN
jgi:hypothetical protein